MIGVVHQTLLLCPCCSGQTDVLPGHIAHHCLRANDHYNRDIAITFPAQLLSSKLPSPYLTGCYNFRVRSPPSACFIVYVFFRCGLSCCVSRCTKSCLSSRSEEHTSELQS